MKNEQKYPVPGFCTYDSETKEQKILVKSCNIFDSILRMSYMAKECAQESNVFVMEDGHIIIDYDNLKDRLGRAFYNKVCRRCPWNRANQER